MRPVPCLVGSSPRPPLLKRQLDLGLIQGFAEARASLDPSFDLQPYQGHLKIDQHEKLVWQLVVQLMLLIAYLGQQSMV